jgi:hypothetical protein
MPCFVTWLWRLFLLCWIVFFSGAFVIGLVVSAVSVWDASPEIGDYMETTILSLVCSVVGLLLLRLETRSQHHD